MGVNLSVENLSFSYGARAVLNGIDLPHVASGCVTAVIGPNAAGKSTLFKCLAGLLRGKGEVRFDGAPLAALDAATRRRRLCYLPQEAPVNAVLTVLEAVLLARKRDASWRVGDDDLTAVGAAISELGIEDLASRHLDELSGGQKQLVSLAQAVVRAPDLLLLDEPTSALDLQHQVEVLDLVQDLTRTRDITTLVAIHDLNLALRYADAIVVLKDGRLRAHGAPAEVLTEDLVSAVYGVRTRIRCLDGILTADRVHPPPRAGNPRPLRE